MLQRQLQHFAHLYIFKSHKCFPQCWHQTHLVVILPCHFAQEGNCTFPVISFAVLRRLFVPSDLEAAQCFTF